MIKISNICLHQNSIFIKFLKILKIHEIFCKNPRIIFVLFYDVHKENMFTINLEDGREAPSIFGRNTVRPIKLWKRRRITIKLKLLYPQSLINIKHSNCAMYTDPLELIHANGKTI